MSDVLSAVNKASGLLIRYYIKHFFSLVQVPEQTDIEEYLPNTSICSVMHSKVQQKMYYE